MGGNKHHPSLNTQTCQITFRCNLMTSVQNYFIFYPPKIDLCKTWCFRAYLQVSAIIPGRNSLGVHQVISNTFLSCQRQVTNLGWPPGSPTCKSQVNFRIAWPLCKHQHGRSQDVHSLLSTPEHSGRRTMKLFTTLNVSFSQQMQLSSKTSRSKHLSTGFQKSGVWKKKTHIQTQTTSCLEYHSKS